MTPTVHDYREAAGAIERAILSALKERRIVRVALSGGKSPVEVYRTLAKSEAIPWSRVYLFLVDERYVPIKSNDSNYRMICDTLANHVKNLRGFYYYNTREPIAKLAHLYHETLSQFDEPLFDVVVLGLGEDGHTASLFPGSAALTEKKLLVSRTVSPPPDSLERLTLTFPALLSSRKLIFVIRGATKEAVLRRWLSGRATAEELPAAGVLSHPDMEVFYDRAG